MTKQIAIIRNAYTYDFGGGERFPVFLAESLAEQGYEPIVISRNATLLAFATDNNIPNLRGWWWSWQNWSGSRIVLFPAYVLWQCLLYFYYLRVFKKIDPLAVHIQSKDDFIAGTYAAKHLGIRVIWTDHADLKHVWRNLQTPIKNPVGKWVYRVAKHVTTITVVSSSELEEITVHLTAKSSIRRKITVVYNGCADVRSNYSASTNGIFTYVIVSRLVTDKGIGEAIKAFIELHKKHKDTRLVFVGDGPEREQFIAQADGNTAIEFLGYLSDPYTVMSGADVFLQPTYHEGFSISLVEASMFEKPIIATSVGGNMEIIHNEQTGLLIPPQNADALLHAMERLYGNPELRNTLAKAARKQYEAEFIFDKIVEERFIPLYD